jgi:iron complex transport system substrate-binding protein
VYGKSAGRAPQRVVCLAPEHVDICRAVGAGDRVVGAPDGVPPRAGAAEAAGVGAGAAIDLDRVAGLGPDLVLAFSDVQADAAAALARRGIAVLCTHQRSVEDVLNAVLLVGGALGADVRAREVVEDMRDEIRLVREYSSVWVDRPRVYVEEWPEPPIAARRLASEVVELAGGRDLFAELREHARASDRVVDAAEVARRDPQLVFASWCGVPVDASRIAGRPGWAAVAAVRDGQIHEIDAADILVAGPSVLSGLRKVHDVVQRWMQAAG